MKSTFPKFTAIAFVGLIALGSLQGTRLESIQDSEQFYRWAISAATLTRLGDTLEPDASLDVPEAMDDEVFADLVALAENILPDYEIDPDLDVDADGNPNSKLVRAVRQSHDNDIWDLVENSASTEIRAQFLEYRSARKIQSMGTQFSAGALYSEGSQVDGVGLTGLFFGFRSVAANFLWMQVDNFWHKGELHRMVPLMRTCVALDPNFIDAYMLGSWHLAYNIPAKIEATPEPLKHKSPKYHRRVGLKEEWYLLAVDFLRDGIRKNPRDYRLYFDLGYGIYARKLNDHPNAIIYLDEARRHKHDKWVPRMLFSSLFQNGQYEDAIEGWEQYLVDYPGHDIGMRFLNINKGFLAETIADEARECQDLAHASIDEKKTLLESETNSLNRQRIESEIASAESFITGLDGRIQQELTSAMTIWNELYQVQEDSMALGRMVRRQALELHEQGRHMEAISELEIVRWQDLQFFDDASNIMIDIKQEANIPLTVSEQLQVLRLEDAVDFAAEYETQEPILRIDCGYIHQQ